MSIAVDVHNMWTEADASPSRYAAIVRTLLELKTGGKFGVGIRALVAIDPQLTAPKLTDQQVLDAIAVEICYERCGVSDIGVDRSAVGLQPQGRSQLVTGGEAERDS